MGSRSIRLWLKTAKFKSPSCKLTVWAEKVLLVARCFLKDDESAFSRAAAAVSYESLRGTMRSRSLGSLGPRGKEALHVYRNGSL